MREVLVRNGYILPSKKTALLTNAYLRAIFQGTIWCQHESRVVFKQCCNPPTVHQLCERIIDLLTLQACKAASAFRSETSPTGSGACMR